MKKTTIDWFRNIGKDILSVIKWAVIGIAVGFIVGAIGTLFSFCLSKVTALRGEYNWLVYLLPIGGLVIVGMYKLLKMENDRGTNIVLESVDKDAQVPAKMAPLIFAATTITHLFGGSAGREGAALQLGGSLGNLLGKLLHLDKKDIKVIIMSGMSAAFAALFGTPMAAAVFAIESATVGVMYYAALLPCTISAFIAGNFAKYMGMEGEHFTISGMPEFGAVPALKIALLAALCGIISILFCLAMEYTKKYLCKGLKNPFLRIAVAALVFIGITKLIGGTDFYGTGMGVIEKAVNEGDAMWFHFILKIILTALILGAGFKGGEIVPTFFVGATFGCVFGKLIGISPSLAAAVGMGAMFCGVTNCPLSAILICFELFGFESMPFIAIAIAISYVTSGHIGIYSAQNIVFSKFKNESRKDIKNE